LVVPTAAEEIALLSQILSTSADWLQTLARVALGVIFFAHGSQKLLGWFGGQGLRQTVRTMTEHLGLPALLAFGAIGGEFFGGFALIVGLLGRLAAAGIVIIMLSAILMVHGKYGLFLNWFGDREGHGYEYHLLAIALALVIVVRGSGALSLDRVLSLSGSA
jgi:putative oxidoreductase